jgi:TonB family protein
VFDIVTAVPRTPASALAASAAIHAAAILALLTIGFSGVVSKLNSQPLRFTLIAPASARIKPPPRQPLPPPLPALPPPPASAPRVFARLTAPLPQPKLILDPPPPVETPRVSAPQPAELPRVAPPPLKTGSFSEALAPPPAARQQPAMQSAGFASSETSRLKPSRSLAPSTGAFESASAQQPGSRRAVAPVTAGFGEASATPGPSAARPAAAPAGSFGDSSIAAPTPRPSASSAPSVTTPVEILDKPRPAYTEEARRLKLEGEVLLEVSFSASGQARVVRLVRGLGHGLDEAAAAAAALIRFRPARREGIPVDSSASVHIVFQLAI